MALEAVVFYYIRIVCVCVCFTIGTDSLMFFSR